MCGQTEISSDVQYEDLAASIYRTLFHVRNVARLGIMVDLDDKSSEQYHINIVLCIVLEAYRDPIYWSRHHDQATREAYFVPVRDLSSTPCLWTLHYWFRLICLLP